MKFNSLASRMMMRLLIVATAAWLLAAAEAARNSADDRTFSCTRLPLTVRPTKYDVHLKFASVDSDTYEGQVDIAIDFPLSNQKKRSLKDLSAKPEFAELIRGFSSQAEVCESDYILMHAGANIEIVDLQVLRDSRLGSLVRGDKMKQRQVSKVERDGSSGQLAIKLANVSRSKDNVISISFKGKMRQDKRGIYVSTYNDGQNVYKHIVSQFQPTDARTAFPCFDEPRFKVPFSVSVAHESELTAYGNTEAEHTARSGDGLMNTRFTTTPNMPIHMLAFVIGQFDKLESSVNGVKVRVLTEPGKRNAGQFALQVAMDSLAYFEKYIDFKFPLKKLDVVAIADHDKDNTESWGLVFVRDTLLWIDEETKEDTKITTAVNVAHVVVHQWFGNLISVAWWSDLWITEGVAAQFAFKIVQERYAFQSEYFVRLAILSGVMQSDQPGKLHTLSPPREELQTTEQIYGLFDNLEFMKSGSMAEMMLEIVPGKYQSALQRLVKSRAYKTVTVHDYLEAFLQGRSPLAEPNVVGLVETFTKFKGVPLISLSGYESRNRLCYIIEPFATARKSVTDQRWSAKAIRLLMPVVYGEGAKNIQDLDKVDMQAADAAYVSQEAACPNLAGIKQEPTGFVKLSPNPTIATYFRTRYSDELLDRLKLAVQNKWISPMDRLQLLDDHNQLALAGLISPETFGKFIEAYAQEDDRGVVLGMMSVKKTLADLKQPEALASIEPSFMNVFERYSGFRVVGDESVLLQRLRSVVLKAYITQGNQQVIDAAVKAFEEANGDMALFLRDPVYTAIVVSGSSQVESLQAKLAKTKSYEEQIRLIGALSLSKDKQVLQKTLDWINSSGLKAETVKPYVEAIRAGLN